MRALLAGFPDRLARRSNPGSLSGRMVGRRGFRLAEWSAVRNAMLFLAIDVDRGASESLVRQASAIDRTWLDAEHLQTRVEVEFESSSKRVIARRRVYWDDLLLEESPEALPSDDRPAQVLAAAATEHLEAVLPAPDTAAGEYLRRIRWLSGFMPELELPAFDDDNMKAMLPDLCRGCRSFEDLRNAAWLSHIQGRLTSQQQNVLQREAPERLEVPSGSRVALSYEPGKPPVLAVRIQEIFGLLETPRLAGGRVGVLFHLLAPNMRPEQVTGDLASFWKTTYHQVRKDLRRRYPKHSWPEDPYTAKAEHRLWRKS
jgi:ATP-dependent helicase HrpB